MKAYTDIEQSKKLAEILPIESADMYYYTVNGDWEWYETPNVIERRDDLEEHAMPAWSLAALLEILPDEIIDDNGYNILINIEKYDLKYKVTYFTDLNFSDRISTDEYENLVDACVEMILKLHEQNLLLN